MTWAELFRSVRRPLPLLVLLAACAGVFMVGGAMWTDRTPFGQTTAGWVQAVGSIAAILAAVWLQDRDRRLKERDARKAQIVALIAIAQRCVSTLTRLDRLAKNGGLTPDRVRRYSDELEADEAVISAIDLMSLADAAPITYLLVLRRNIRSARRRLRYWASLRSSRPIKPERFKLLVENADYALEELTKLQEPSHSPASSL